MADVTKESLSCQVGLELRDLNSDEGLPFQHLLSPERIMAAMEAAGVEFRERIFTPTVTLWAFLRIGKNPRVFTQPLSTQEAQSAISAWFDQPATGLLDPGERHWEI